MDTPGAQLWLTAALEEYRSLRAESLASMGNQQSTLSLGVAALGVLLGLGIKADGEVRGVILVGVVPLFAVAVYLLYAIEFGRMVRVGRYIALVEKRISGRLPEPSPLSWEGWLDTKVDSRSPRLPFYWTVPLIIATAAAGSVAAEVLLTSGPPTNPPNWPLLLSTIASTVVSSAAVVRISLRLRGLRREFDRFFPRGRHQSQRGASGDAAS